MDSKNLAIGILSTTAVILLVGLLIIQSRPEPAYGFGMNAQGGDYLVTTGQLDSAQELLYVIDARSGQLLAYRFDMSRQQISIVSRGDLSKLQSGSKAGGHDSDKSSRGKRGRGRGRGR